MTRKIALSLMATGWLVGFTIAAIPVIWNKWEHALECEFDQIFYPWYMVGVVTPVSSLACCLLNLVIEESQSNKEQRQIGARKETTCLESFGLELLSGKI